MKALMILSIFMFSHTFCTAQGTYFTDSELQLLAEHNTERLYLKNLVELNKQEIDSLYKKVDLIQSQFDLCDENQETLNGIITKLNDIDGKRKEQIAILVTENQEQEQTIKKQSRKLNRWRIITPIISAGAFVVGVFIK